MTPWHGRHHQDYYIFSGTGILGLGNRSKGYPATEQLEKNGPAQNIWILLKNRSFWAKSLLKFSCKALGIPKEKKSLDRPLIPPKMGVLENHGKWEILDANMQKKNTSGFPLASCFILPKKIWSKLGELPNLGELQVSEEGEQQQQQ